MTGKKKFDISIYKHCPDCGELAVAFTRDENNKTTTLGYICLKHCGWELTFQDLLREVGRLREVLQQIEEVNDE